MTGFVDRDERPAKLLARTPVGDAHRARMLTLVEHAQARAEAAGVDLQYEFGEAVACIAGCQQFLRLHRGGEAPGAVEVLVPDASRAALEQAGFTAREALGQVFRMFGWTRVDPMEGDAEALQRAVEDALERALAQGKPAL